MAERNDEVFQESPHQKWKREIREYEQKNIANYSVQINAWFNTKLEKDKSIITISSAAIGLLVTIITSKGVQSFCQGIFYFFAFASFLTSIITSINIMDKNALQIEKDLSGEGNINEILGRDDLIIKFSFYAGLVFTILVGISYGANQYLERHTNMEKEKTASVQKQVTSSRPRQQIH